MPTKTHVKSETRCFSGRQLRIEHNSKTLNCEMVYGLYLPPQAEHSKVPALLWLSGLTCNDENFSGKAGAQRIAAELGIAIIAPDTSPRGKNVPDDVNGAYDFGLGAGFYVTATQASWSEHYNMYDYVKGELLETLVDFPIDLERLSISGHSMGGHGALTIGLKNNTLFKSISAFSPICSPMNCPWGEKALSNYIGDDRSQWAQYDSCELVKQASTQLPILVDQGSADNFLAEQLKTHLLVVASEQANYPMTIRMQDGYDHSYYFIASFIEEHLRFHARYLLSQ